MEQEINQTTNQEVNQEKPQAIQTQSHKKTYILMIGGLTLLIFALIGGIFLLSKKDTQKNIAPIKPTPTAQITPTPTIATGVVCKRFTRLQEALKNIETACVLDLSGASERITSADLAKLSNLNEINLQNNNLSQVPPALFELKKLLLIDLSNNKITTIPTTIATTEIVKTLQVLILTGNPINPVEQEKIKGLLPNTTIIF